MSGKTVNSAILLLVIGNAMAILSNVFIKLLEPGAPIFQFAFLRCILTLFMLMPLAGKPNRKHLFAGFKVHALRSHIHLAGMLCMVVALPGHRQRSVLRRAYTGDGARREGVR